MQDAERNSEMGITEMLIYVHDTASLPLSTCKQHWQQCPNRNPPPTE